jgi:hypothetical protein
MKHVKAKTRSTRSPFLVILTLLAAMMMIGSYTPSATAAACPGGQNSKTLTANVVAIDQPIMFNRLGAQNVNYMMYALERDVVVSNKPSNSSSSGSGYSDGKPITQILYETDENGDYVLDDEGRKAARGMLKGNVALRPDKRPRPLVLRVAAGDCLEVNLTNLLEPQANPRNGAVNPNNCQAGAPGTDIIEENGRNACQNLMNINDQVAGRQVSFHPLGLQLVGNIDDTGSNVGLNNSSLVDTGQSATYTYFAESENAYMVYSRGQMLGGEASGGNVGVGLFGVVNVEPKGASFYRSQVTEEEMRLATKGHTNAPGKGFFDKQPIIDYEATYDDVEPWKSEGKDGLPVLNMVHNDEIVHSDINAIIVGPNADGSFPQDTYPLESVGLRNPSLPNRLEAFREFTVVFHDEQAATQAFPLWFGHPVTGHTLHGVRDSFMINYGSGGIGSEIIANRLRVGPMWDCLNCAYEEFFLSSYTVGDPAMLVDVPANANLEMCGPDELARSKDDLAAGNVNECINPASIGGVTSDGADPGAVHGIKATQAFYPDDPANIHHSYKRDFVKFRNLHAGPKEQHIFHLHNHQWLFNPNDDNSNYIDAQGIGPGSGYTYEINFWGGGNRNISAGDAIFHCHFYPHFAQGMWEHWRINDVYQTGTVLAATPEDAAGNLGYHVWDKEGAFDDTGKPIPDGKPDWALKSGLPALYARAYPDGEIIRGTPIPAVVPLPGVALPPMPGAEVRVVPKTAVINGQVKEIGSVADVIRAEGMSNPGYPFWIAGIEHTVGQRSPTPPLDMLASPDEDPTTFDAGDLAARCTAETKDPDDFFIDGNGDEKCLWSHPGLVAGAGGWDGGLPRHALEGYLAGGLSLNIQNRLDFTKVIEKAKPIYYPEEGTDLEKIVMAFNAVPFYDSSILRKNQYGEWIDSKTKLNGDPVRFQTNGQLPVPSAPFYEPCRDDQADLFLSGEPGQFWNADVNGGYYTSPTPTFGADDPRVYMGANIQIDAVLNKVGYHYPQQRIIALWEDVDDVIKKNKAPEPLVMRANSFDCVKYLHANLVPEYFELDDYQVRTPTDIIGQHIHLPKWDLVSNDGSGNGWNYEDGTLSPGMVRERIHAINKFVDTDPNTEACDDPLEGDPVCLHEKIHPFFGPGLNDGAQNWIGARTTVQRWFTDPVVNTELVDRGLGLVFTHDHYGPSTHQQVGLYATILAQPYGSVWKHNETGEVMYTRADGGPTSWQGIVEPVKSMADLTDEEKAAGVAGLPESAEPFREFYFEFGDFQHAYEAGTYVGISNQEWGDLTATKNPVTHSPVTGDGNILHLTAIGMDVVLTDPIAPPGQNGQGGAIDAGITFQTAINPSFRQEPKDKADVFPDIARFPPWCPGTPVEGGVPVGPIVPRPCAEAISADDVGLIGVNYRVEPVGLRVYDPKKRGPDNNLGTQAGGLNENGIDVPMQAGDLAFALQSRTDRAIPEMNVQPDGMTTIKGTKFPPPLNHGGLNPGDPFTPLLRAYPGDLVKIKIQAGSTEHEHNAIIHGVKWRQSGSAFGQAPNSGWRNAQNDGISEQFTFSLPVGSDPARIGTTTDYAYSVDASQDGWWTGVWGIMRTYDSEQTDANGGKLQLLSSNLNPKPGRIINARTAQGGGGKGKKAQSEEVVTDFDGVCPIYAKDKDGNDVLDPTTGEPVPITRRQYTIVAMTANQLLGNALGLKLDTNEAAGANGFASEDHVGARPDISGGTLVYNNRQGGDMRSINDTTGDDPETGTRNPKKSKALHDPTALLYVNVDDLQEVGAHLDGYKQSRGCNDNKGQPGVLRASCQVELKPTAPIEPVAIRAAAGDCIEVTLYNKLPEVVPDLAGYNTVLQMVNRRVDNTNSLLTFNNNLIKPSSHVGLHPQLVEYDASQDDGTNVGLNAEQTVGPVNPDGSLAKAHTYRWYAGHLSTVPATEADCIKYGVRGSGCGNGNDLMLVARPVELGGFNLNPADKIKQGQKGLVGAGVILPQGATWDEDAESLELVMDHQVDGNDNDAKRGTRLSMEVTKSDGEKLKDVALVFQKGTNQRFSDDNDGATAIPNLAAEGQGVPEDSHDAGQMAINYGTEPLWYRFNMRADEPFGNAQEGLGSVGNSHEAFSNNLAGVNGDPVTPVVTATPKQDLRMRLLMPTGSGRGTTFVLDGHAWQRDPYICDYTKDTLVGRCATNDVAAPTKIGHNPIGFVLGHQESVTPSAHFDIVPLNGAGGINGIEGDHLFIDQGSFGPTSGLWGILRVKAPPPPPGE